MPSSAARAADVATIAATRAFYQGLATACEVDVVQIEVALGNLAGLELDQATLDGFQSTQEDARCAVVRCRRVLAELAGHGLMEDAVNATPDAAKAEFYQEGAVIRAWGRRTEGEPPMNHTSAPAPAGVGNTLGIPDAPGLTNMVASAFIGGDVGVAYAVDACDPSDATVLFTVGTPVEAIRQMSPPPAGQVPPGWEENLAVLTSHDVATFCRRLVAVTRAAETGRQCGPETITCTDIGDVEIEAVDGRVRITLLPYGIDQPYDEPFAPEPLTEVETDDGMRAPTPDEVDEYLADERGEYEREVATYDAARTAHRHRLTTYLTPDQARQLCAGLAAGVRGCGADGLLIQV